jgi:hypothetical protein
MEKTAGKELKRSCPRRSHVCGKYAPNFAWFYKTKKNACMLAFKASQAEVKQILVVCLRACFRETIPAGCRALLLRPLFIQAGDKDHVARIQCHAVDIANEIQRLRL